MPYSDSTAVNAMEAAQNNAIDTWDALPSGQKTFAKWKSIVFDGMIAAQTTALRLAPSGDPVLRSCPPPPSP